MKQPNEIKFRLLADCQQHIQPLAQLQFNEISRHWVPNTNVEKTKQRLEEHLNHAKLPLTIVALYNETPVGMVSLRNNDGIRPDLTPWLGSLVVAPSYRGCQIGEQLISRLKQQASIFGYQELYLLAFDPTIPQWYGKL